MDGSQVVITADDPGTLYYTLDGSDPRLPDLPGASVELIAEFAPASGFIPSVANGGSALGDAWKGGVEPFDDAAWITGDTGIGFGYPGLVGIDVTAMRGNTGSAYLRVPFEFAGSPPSTLVLNMKFEDGFVAYLNGVEVASENRPASLEWDSSTGVTRADTEAIEFAPYDISSHIGDLRSGTNILAIQVMNSSANNADALALPRLVATSAATSGPSPSAMVYPGPIDLAAAATVTARLENNGRWSGPVTASILIDTIPADASNLVISEIMYRPGETTPAEELADLTDRDEFEFIELLNIHPTATLDLSGVRFVDSGGAGITFDFATATTQFLRPGARIVLVENVEAFAFRNGSGIAVGGQFGGNLSNDGELLTLLDHAGHPIRNFTYNDQLPWPTAADGEGPSLVLIAPETNPDHADPLNWAPSAASTGAPGAPDGVRFMGAASELVDFAVVDFAPVLADGRPGLAYTLDLAGTSVRVRPEYSPDLATWQPDPGDGSVLVLESRTWQANGTEAFAWRATSPGFFRLKVADGVP